MVFIYVYLVFNSVKYVNYEISVKLKLLLQKYIEFNLYIESMKKKTGNKQILNVCFATAIIFWTLFQMFE